MRRLKARAAKQIKTLKASVAKVKGFLKDRPDKLGRQGKPIQSNITDNDSAKIKTGKGVIQGYAGMAVVDARHQVIVGAQAFGAGAGARAFHSDARRNPPDIPRARSVERCSQEPHRHGGCGLLQRSEQPLSTGERDRCVRGRPAVPAPRRTLCRRPPTPPATRE